MLLYQHCCSLSTIVEKMENNVYPVRTKRSGIRQFSIPSSDRPYDIFHEKNRLVLLREQLKLSRQGVKELNKQDELMKSQNNAAAAATTTTTTTTTINNSNNRNGGDNGIDPNRPPSVNTTAVPPAAATIKNRRTMNGSASIVHSNAKMDMGEYQVPVMIPLLFPRDDIEDGLALEETISSLSMDDLVQQIKEMREYIKTGLRRKVEEQVLNDLSSHETIAYIKAVEDERDHYKNTVSYFFVFNIHKYF